MFYDDSTEEECLRRNLFGNMARRLENLGEIEPGDMGFLLNINRDELIGIFRACSEPQLHIEPDAWDGRFAAQVRVEPIGELQRIKDAAYILKKAGLETRQSGKFGESLGSALSLSFYLQSLWRYVSFRPWPDRSV